MPDGFRAALLGDAETAAHLSDAALLRDMIRVEAALARAQGALGTIPAAAAAAIAAALDGPLAEGISPGDLAAGAARDGVPVPALLARLRPLIGAEARGYLHWGATSQDIVDTATALALRDLLDLWEGRLDTLLAALGRLAGDHADMLMAARTYGQAAVPTTFGALVASWGRPLWRHRARTGALREAILLVSLGGAAGTLAAMERGPEVRAALARDLGLADPGAPWHSERDGIAALAGWAAGLLGTLGKMAADLLHLTQGEVGEVRIAGAGGSSTMPHKENPVGPSALLAVARSGIGLAAALEGAAIHGLQRDGAAWFAEWLALPPLAERVGAALRLALDHAGRLVPDREAMARNLDGGGGAAHAEALAFALASLMPRAEAEAELRRLAAAARAGGGSLPDLVRAAHSGLVWAGPDPGEAPDLARAFADQARTRRRVRWT